MRIDGFTGGDEHGTTLQRISAISDPNNVEATLVNGPIQIGSIQGMALLTLTQLRRFMGDGTRQGTMAIQNMAGWSAIAHGDFNGDGITAAWFMQNGHINGTKSYGSTAGWNAHGRQGRAK